MKKYNLKRNEVETRDFPFEVRQEGDGGKVILRGHAAVFNRQTVLVPADAWFKGSPEIREVIEPGAFTKTLAERDVRAIWNHNTDIVLGRKENKTLRLWENETGLANEIEPPDTALVRDMVIAPIQRGDVDQMSFGFRIVREKVIEEDNTVTIQLKELDLVEVSPVTIPAYPQTDIGISARSSERLEEIRQRRQAAVSQPEPAPLALAGEHPDQSTPANSDHPAEAAPVATCHLDSDYMELELVRRGLRRSA